MVNNRDPKGEYKTNFLICDEKETHVFVHLWVSCKKEKDTNKPYNTSKLSLRSAANLF